MSQVSIYNLGGQELLGKVSLQHAIKMVYQQKARILKAIAGEHFGPYEMPTAVELLKYRYARWKYERTGEISFSKRAVLRRDDFKCAYCLKPANTVDHVLPRWKGNALTWNNAVAACRSCNSKKGGRTPEEAGMKLLFLPRTPSFEEAYKLRNNRE